MMRCVTKATPIHFINRKCHNQYKETETGLANHIGSISHHIMTQVINALKGGHTDTDTHTCEQKQFQETRFALACIHLV